MKQKNIKLLSFIATLSFAASLAACDNNSSSNQPSEGDGDGPIGITQRPNDFEGNIDIRPPREDIEDNTPLDEGELVDHIYQFEDLFVTGTSHKHDHFCVAKSFVFSPIFDEHIALECIDEGSTFTFTFNSNKAVRVPLSIKMSNNYSSGQELNVGISIKNNYKNVCDTSVIVPEEGVVAPFAPEGYFNMTTVNTYISIFEGKNKIVFEPHNGTNIDSFNLKTSATIENQTVSNLVAPNISVDIVPTETTDGQIIIDDTTKFCNTLNKKAIPNLTNECYEVREDKHYLNLAGQEICVDEKTEVLPPDEKLPVTDKGKLERHTFEIENAKITGNSRQTQDIYDDHYCSTSSLVYSPSFSGGLCVENINPTRLGDEALINHYTFEIESSAAYNVPFELSFGSMDLFGLSLDSFLDIDVNGNKENVVATAPTSTKPDYIPDLPKIADYFKMTKGTGVLALKEGLNTITITNKEYNYNLDSFTILTSANLVDKTIPTYSGENTPIVEVVKEPTDIVRGTLSIKCAHEGCERPIREHSLPALSVENYIVKEKDGFNEYYINILNKEYFITKASTKVVEKTTNTFEFENAKIEGISKQGQVESDHFCVSDATVICPDFSGNICLENVVANKATFTFVIESDKATTATFELGIGSVNGRVIGDVFDIKNNNDASLIDASANASTQEFVPDLGDLSMWFHMVKGNGTINLVQGINTITITPKDYINLDYFSITSDATLIDKTVSTFQNESKVEVNVTEVPTLDNPGKISVKCAHEGCSKAARVNSIPALTNSTYNVKEIANGNEYYINLFGKEYLVYSSNEEVVPETKKDYTFEFENAQIEGISKNGRVESDHFCAVDSSVFCPDFSGNICLENVVANKATFTFVIESDRETEASFTLGIGTINGATVDSKFDIKNNNDETLVDGSQASSTETFRPNLGELSIWFNMTTAKGTIKLLAGTNTITITPKDYINLDYLKINTEAKLLDKTISHFQKVEKVNVEVTSAPANEMTGKIAFSCSHQGCSRSEEKRVWDLPALNDARYTVIEEDSFRNYYLTIFNEKYLISSINLSKPIEKMNYFEFENAQIEGISKNGQVESDHFCAIDSTVFCPDFSGNVCLENVVANKATFTFVIESDKATTANFELGIGTIYGGVIGNAFDIKNNNDASLVDASANASTQEMVPNLGDLSVWFHMVKGNGTINLVEGINTITITPKDYINLDYFAISTDANLVDKTVPHFATTEKANIEVTKAPTAESIGEISFNCSHEGCSRVETPRKWTLPALTDSCYVNENGHYYLTVYNQKIQIA